MRKPKGIEEKLELALNDMPPMKNEKVESINVVDDAMKDYAFVREVLKNSISKSSEVLDHVLQLVQCEVHPHFINATSGLLRTIAENSKDLINLHTSIIDTKNKLGTLEKEVKNYNNGSVINEEIDKPKTLTGNIHDIVSACHNEKKEQKKFNKEKKKKDKKKRKK